MTLAFMLCFQSLKALVMVEALIRLKGGRLGPKAPVSLARSLVTRAADLW
jgi:hypothetical protein